MGERKAVERKPKYDCVDTCGRKKYAFDVLLDGYAELHYSYDEHDPFYKGERENAELAARIDAKFVAEDLIRSGKGVDRILG